MTIDHIWSFQKYILLKYQRYSKRVANKRVKNEDLEKITTYVWHDSYKREGSNMTQTIMFLKSASHIFQRDLYQRWQ